MNARSVTIFVRPFPGGYQANTMATTMAHPRSGTIAAREVAARFFEVSPDRIELLPVDNFVMIGRVRDAAPPRCILAGLAILLVTATGALALFYCLGGAR